MASLCKERGGIYRIHWKFKVRVGPRTGETIDGSLQLGRCTKAAAKAQLRDIDAWEQAVKTGRHVPDQGFQDVCARWLRERELSRTPQSCQRSRRVISLYLRWREKDGLPSRSIEDFANRDDLIAWRDHRLNHEVGPKTVANDLSNLAPFFTWCVHEKYLTENPLNRVSRPRTHAHKEGTPLTRTQAGRWLRSIRVRRGRTGRGPRSWEEVCRKRQLIVFLLNTGLRNGELCALNIEDVRVDEHERLVYVMGKGSKERWVPLNRAALAALRLHLRVRRNPTRGPLFVNQTGDLHHVRQLASEIRTTARCIDDELQVNPHNLRHRHTFATWLARSVSDVAIVQKILGHENVNTTLKYYVHTCDSELAGATSGLRGRPLATRRSGNLGDRYRIIPFPKASAG